MTGPTIQYRFGTCTYRVDDRLLCHGSFRITLPMQEARVLEALLEKPARVRSRSELAALVWSDGYNGDVGPAINNLVSRLRNSLPAQSCYILTVPKSGYKLSLEVDCVEESLAVFVPQTDAIPAGTGTPFAPSAPAPLPAPLKEAPRSSRLRAMRWFWLAPALIVVVAFGFIAFLRHRVTAAAPKQSVTIGLLPFVSSGIDPATAETIREQLADALAEVPGTEVRAAHSLPESLIRNPASIPATAQRLNLSLLLAGSLSVKDGKYHCDLELIRGSSGDHISSLHYDDVESAISRLPERIDHDLVPLLLRRPQAGTQRALGSTSDQQAFDLAFQASAALHQRTKNSVTQAIDLYSKAVSLDPMFAHAWTGLGEANLVRANFGSSAETGTYFQAAITDAKRALQLNPNDAQGHSTLGLALLQYDWDLKQAEQELAMSVQRSPSSASARLHFAVLLADEGRMDAAIAQVDQARALDPDWPVIYGTAMYVHIVARQFANAIADAKSLVSLAPDWSRAHQHLGWAYWYAGKQQMAIAEWLRADQLDGKTEQEKMEEQGAEVLTREGVRAYALYKLQHELAGAPDDDFVAAEWFAFAGDREQTTTSLQTMVRSRNSESLKIPSNPAYDFLRGDSAFRALVGEMQSAITGRSAGKAR